MYCPVNKLCYMTCSEKNYGWNVIFVKPLAVKLQLECHVYRKTWKIMTNLTNCKQFVKILPLKNLCDSLK